MVGGEENRHNFLGKDVERLGALVSLGKGFKARIHSKVDLRQEAKDSRT